jgi:hypothetical protein
MQILRKKYSFCKPEGDESSAGGTVTTSEAGQQGADQQNQPDEAQHQLETRARAMGWTPKEEFRGDPSKWRDAGEFIERGEREVPLLRAQNKRLETKIAELERTTRDFAEHLSKTEQRAYDRALADLKEQRKQALAAGDGDAFEKVDDAIEKLRSDAEKAAAKNAKQDNPGDDPVYKEWESRNKWLSEPELQEYAEFAAQRMRNNGEKATGADFLDLVAKKVKERFPEKFTNPRRESAQSVEGAAPGPRKGGKAYADMPAEARAACDRMAKNGFGGDEKAMAKFKADYVKQYFEEA